MSARTTRRPSGTGARQGESPRQRRERLEAEREAIARAADRRRKVTIGLVVGLVLALVTALAVTWFVRDARAKAAPTASVDGGKRVVALEPGRPLVYGEPGAKTVLEIWENPRCPHCVDFQRDFQGLINEAVREGRVTVHIYPLTGGDPVSRSAVLGLTCAAEAGYGLQYWDGIFQNPEAQWREDQLVALYKAVSRGEDATAFYGCLQSRRHDAWVDSIRDQARAQKVEFTPTVKRNGVEIDTTKLTEQTMKEHLR